MSPRNKVRRGPRLLDGVELEADVLGVLMPQVIGVTLRMARKAQRVSQVELAHRLRVPQSTVSKLERGTITQGVYHLDLFAEAISNEDLEWQGWELFRVASRLADLLDHREGLRAYWISPGKAPPGRFVAGTELRRLAIKWWHEAVLGVD